VLGRSIIIPNHFNSGWRHEVELGGIDRLINNDILETPQRTLATARL
jgi:hypothetical protein